MSTRVSYYSFAGVLDRLATHGKTFLCVRGAQEETLALYQPMHSQQLSALDLAHRICGMDMPPSSTVSNTCPHSASPPR